MNRSVEIVVFVIATISAVAWIAWDRGWGRSLVTAQVENATGEPVSAVTIKIDMCGEHRTVAIGALAVGTTGRIRYPVCGEGGYSVEARFEDGRVIKGSEGYVESGYVSSDKISASGVTSIQAVY